MQGRKRRCVERRVRGRDGTEKVGNSRKKKKICEKRGRGMGAQEGREEVGNSRKRERRCVETELDTCMIYRIS